jgi:membrane dipeptidase
MATVITDREATKTPVRWPMANGLAAPWPEDLTADLLAELRQQGVAVAGTTATRTWDDTLEALEGIQEVKATVRDFPGSYIIRDRAGLDEGVRTGAVGVLLGLQNPKPLNDRISLLEAFYDLGLRCISLAFCDQSYFGSAFDAVEDRGLSRLGKTAIKRMNELGIVVDLSHSGDRTALEAIEVSDKPALFSHSCARAKFPSPRNASDDVIRAAGQAGGVICLDAREGTGRGTISLGEFVDQIDHVVEVAGAGSVGVAAEADGARSFKDTKLMAQYLPGAFGGRLKRFMEGKDPYAGEHAKVYEIVSSEKLAAELAQRGYSNEDAGKIVGGNVLRVLGASLR